MEKNTSFEAYRSSVGQEIPSAIYGTQMFISCSQQPPSLALHRYSLPFGLHILFYIFLLLILPVNLFFPFPHISLVLFPLVYLLVISLFPFLPLLIRICHLSSSSYFYILVLFLTVIPLLDPILRQMNPIYISILYILNPSSASYFIIIFPK